MAASSSDDSLKVVKSEKVIRENPPYRPKYAKDKVLELTSFLEKFARIRARIVEILHEPGLIAFKVLSDVGTLLQATNLECLEAIPTTGIRAMTIPQMAHYLGDLRAIYDVAENNNADEEPSRLILQAWLGANVGYVKDTRVFETPDFITADQKEYKSLETPDFITAEKKKTLMILRKKESVSSPTLSHFLSSSI